MTLRPATPDDAPAIALLEAACFGDEAWSPRAIASALSAGPAWLLLLGDAPTAYALGAQVVDEAELHRIATLPAARGQGLGRRLLDAFCASAQAKGASRVFLEVRAENRPAIALYVSAGFVLVGRRRRYYADGSDACLYAWP